MKSICASKKIDINQFFLNHTDKSIEAYKEAVKATQEIIIDKVLKQPTPYVGKSFDLLTKEIGEISSYNETGKALSDVLKDVQNYIVENSLFVSNPFSIAHLHCPPMIPALAAEMLISSLNQSMDSWDQSPSATILEQQVIRWICEIFQYTKGSDGVFTSGGTLSNYMGLLLARNYYCNTYLNWNVQKSGLPSSYHKLRILCSEHAHFTVSKSAMQLGLGTDSVVVIKTDSQQRMCVEDLRLQIENLGNKGLLPFAVVATAGTTNFGSIDSLSEIADYLEGKNIWLHVDAAYGGALILSEEYKHRLQGIQHADSITVDFHKLFYQPISCGAFLVKNGDNLNLIKMNADYLNPEDDEADGVVNLVGKSIQTTRRFDALKLYISIQALGIKGFNQIVSHIIELASQAVKVISQNQNIEVYNNSEISAIVFRYKLLEYKDIDEKVQIENQINMLIQKQLFKEGKAAIAKTKIGDKMYLKFTILNPQTSVGDIKRLISHIITLGLKNENMILNKVEGSI
ncbi:pyridoxal phosphate-dependent decarboxylase family protein [Bacillus toyonensis]|uniref:pyridoxal phosphate-dependent decarboxylase family protein n=1 Tax=Bacillus toyonensis TaxID=155322 RepID=UPI000BECA932|nr:aspartate aminotransferase family protein [Bacillus toyonensis]PEC12819.1 aspartate aminotransferase family protein [Bacillus toyonensis]